MPKSSQKADGTEQPTNQRGKSRFGTSVRPGRVVLPERPPRLVDNEIVSILLGADPAALTAQTEETRDVPPSELVEAAPPLTVVKAPASSDALPVDVLTGAEPLPVGDISTTTSSVENTGLASENQVLEENATPQGITTPPPARARRASVAPTARHAAEDTTPPVQSVIPQEGAVSSFAEFAERWKHGLRKGQLKICEVLYQKTYAVGQTECVTSFSELGNLSGLKMRQCFNIIAQLEALRFVERSRSSATSNKKDQGSVIRFYLYPVQ